MELSRWAWTWLTKPAPGNVHKGHPDLYPIDVEKLAFELNVDEEAKRLAQSGQPAADAKKLSGLESQIVQRVEKARQDYVDWAVLRLSVLSQDLGRRNITQEVNRARQADQEFERKASALLTEQDSALRRLADTARRQSAEFAAFQAKHQLVRDAKYPTSSGSFLRLALLVFLIVVEGVLNAAFFAQGLDSGLLGGFLYAGALAAANVLFAFAIGKVGVRYLTHVNLGWKSVGLLSLMFSLVLMVGMGLGIAHFRDSLINGEADAARAALQALLAAPLQLRDFFSWALFAISIGFGLLSLVDGLFGDDLYPGYGAISRSTRAAIDDYEDELEALRTELEELKNDELQLLDQTVQRSQAAVATYRSLIDDKKSAESRLSTALQDADNSLRALLRKFRTENEVHRNGVPRPAYFDLEPDHPTVSVPSFGTETDEAALSKQQALMRSLLAELQSIRARIQTSFNQQFDRLKPLDTHFPSKEER